MNGESKEKWANPAWPIHHAIAEWATSCAERGLPIFEEQRTGDQRPREAIEALHAADYPARAVGLYRGKNAREVERTWQWDNLAPLLRSIGFPKGL